MIAGEMVEKYAAVTNIDFAAMEHPADTKEPAIETVLCWALKDRYRRINAKSIRYMFANPQMWFDEKIFVELNKGDSNENEFAVSMINVFVAQHRSVFKELRGVLDFLTSRAWL